MATRPRVARTTASPMTAKDVPLKRSAADYFPDRMTLPSMREAARGCRGCDLYKNATQVVFGEGAAKGKCVMVGEQPGDQEDRQGHPFVGPAGGLLDRALADAGIDRNSVYITNAVKHFKHEIAGKKRIHKSPNRAEISACRPWLVEELRVIKPKVLVCLGVSAANSIFDKKVTLRDVRGRFWETALSPRTFVTTHPSSILRSFDDESRRENYALFVQELKVLAKELKQRPSHGH
ncbi:MAG: UdgX family uracil-DNA binding protein [Candidatus Sumerlaeaceae bacterium]